MDKNRICPYCGVGVALVEGGQIEVVAAHGWSLGTEQPDLRARLTEAVALLRKMLDDCQYCPSCFKEQGGDPPEAHHDGCTLAKILRENPEVTP
jgi:hypothetical protein